ncbi:helix-turn-helix domain-containing protein [Compostibacter hankyongensis]|uniref:Helix-turn-helix domain-containing protein n=1 Tax=Compostibacter hankyongensis TaxID=1007089 RepID=A0ABP8FK93_9BACT
MKHTYKNNQTSGEFRLVANERELDRIFYGKDRRDKLLTIAWNRGPRQTVSVDSIDYDFPENSVLCLMINQSFYFSHPEDIIAWQFNREFYCIMEHDKEVSCVGFLFYGSREMMFIRLEERGQQKADLLLRVFLEEFETVDNIQEDMLRVLLKRLVIIITRIAKEQYIDHEELTAEKLDIIREYNLLVEIHYKTEHQVKFYASSLNRSPKTLSNLFALYNNKSPLTVIQERIILEAKRLLIYTDKTSKEIAYELGFEDMAYFSNFFKRITSLSPLAFRKSKADFVRIHRG